MKLIESGSQIPVIYANLSNVERELRQLMGAKRPAEQSESTGSGAGPAHSATQGAVE